MESRHLLRVVQSPVELARGFAGYCSANQVLTRGLCKVGFVTRYPPSGQQGGAGTSSVVASLKMRGLVASKDIPKDENVAIVPAARACLHPGTPFKVPSFMRLFPAELLQRHFMVPGYLQNSRVSERSLIRHNQLFLGLYMSYVIIMGSMEPHRLSEVHVPEFNAQPWLYLNFLPRHEGDFGTLAAHMQGWLDGAEVCRESQRYLAEHFGLTQAEVRPVLVYALCMLYSRMVPVDHRRLLRAAFEDTPLAMEVEKLPSAPSPSSDGAAGAVAVAGGSDATSLVSEPISFLCPVLDMCNHRPGDENVAVMVPDGAPPGVPASSTAATAPVLCLRSLRAIRQGEELTMIYGGSASELKVIWGMSNVYP